MFTIIDITMSTIKPLLFQPQNITTACISLFQLMALGSDQFLEAEAEEFVKFTATNTVISLTGSNPMHPKFKPHAQSLGEIFFLDVPKENILKYLNKKTTDAANCIVGKHQGLKTLHI